MAPAGASSSASPVADRLLGIIRVTAPGQARRREAPPDVVARRIFPERKSATRRLRDERGG